MSASMTRIKEGLQDVQVQQAILTLLLLAGLGAHFFLAWWLKSKNYVQFPENLEKLHTAAIQLYLPYIGIAFGGIFGAAKLGKRQVRLSTFVIAISSVALWDALSITSLYLVKTGAQLVEDALHFAENTMPVLSVLVAASIAFYFGTQSSTTQHS